MNDLLKYLAEKENDRGIMSSLRAGLVESRMYKAYPYLGRFDGIGDSMKNKAVRTVAGLFAYHPVNVTFGNIGTVCYQLQHNSGDNDFEKGTFAKRMQYLLAAEKSEIAGRVVRIVLRAGREGIPVNYDQLLTDLIFWNDRTKTEWAKEFWAPVKEEGDG